MNASRFLFTLLFNLEPKMLGQHWRTLNQLTKQTVSRT
jgi:hypothetical protein